MYKNFIGLRRCRMNNDRAEKLVYIYVNSRALKQAREAHCRQRIALDKEISDYELPKLQLDSGIQDPNVYGSLGYEPLISIGVDAFVADNHVHELHDLTLGLSAHGPRVNEGASTSTNSLSGFDEEAELSVSGEGDEKEESSNSDADMDLTPRTRRDVEEMIERQKRARGQETKDKECKTPPYTRASRRAKVVGSPTPHASHTVSNGQVPLASMQDYVALATQ